MCATTTVTVEQRTLLPVPTGFRVLLPTKGEATIWTFGDDACQTCRTPTIKKRTTDS